MPHSEEAELNVLGSILQHPDIMPVGLDEGDFYIEGARDVYSEFLAMHRSGEPISHVTLHERLRGHPVLIELLETISQHSLPPDYGRHFAGIVRKHSERRRLIHCLGAAMCRAYDDEPADVTKSVLETVNSRSRESRRLKVLDSAELLDGDFTIRYVVNDVLPEAQGGVASGRFKTLKTVCGIELMMSVATGTPFLGTFAVPKAMPAGIISAESGMPTLKDIARRVSAAKGVDLRECRRSLLWCAERPRLPEDMGAVERFIVEFGLRALFVDPSYLILSSSGDAASNVYKMGDVLQPITDLVQRTQCSIVLCNHNRKGRMKDALRYDPPELEEISMSGYAEWARFWLLLGPRREWDETTGKHWLWMRAGGSAGHAGLFAVDAVEGRRSDDGGRRWEVAVSTPSQAKRDEQREADELKARIQEQREEGWRRKLLDALTLAPEGETKTKLRDLSGLNAEGFGVAIRHLLTEGRAEICPIKKHTRTEEGYRLKR